MLSLLRMELWKTRTLSSHRGERDRAENENQVIAEARTQPGRLRPVIWKVRDLLHSHGVDEVAAGAAPPPGWAIAQRLSNLVVHVVVDSLLHRPATTLDPRRLNAREGRHLSIGVSLCISIVSSEPSTRSFLQASA